MSYNFRALVTILMARGINFKIENSKKYGNCIHIYRNGLIGTIYDNDDGLMLQSTIYGRVIYFNDSSITPERIYLRVSRALRFA